MSIRCSYLITWRAGSDASRRDNLLAVLAWLAQFPEIEVVLVEQDDAPRLESSLPHPTCRQIFAYNPGPFNKSWGFNLAFRHASTPLLAFGDADIIIPKAQLRQAIDACASNSVVVNPYRRIIDLNEEETQQVRQGAYDLIPLRPVDSASNREAIGERVVFCGGLFLIRRDAFIHLGGWDERFRGWGGEDDAMTYKVERARLPALELDTMPALHLYHPRLRENTFEQAHYAANRALLAEYRDYTDQQLFRLAEIMLQSMGHREKYRPFTP